MIFFNKKKNKLNEIYNKIVQQSKNSFYLISNESPGVKVTLEFFQLNLIIILWYMKSNNVQDKYIMYLVKRFISDLENLFIELGGSETSLRKKIRPIVENFYGRLYSFSLTFDHLEKDKERLSFNKLIKNNFKYKVKRKLLDIYIKNNIIFFRKLKINDFWDMNFDFLNVNK